MEKIEEIIKRVRNLDDDQQQEILETLRNWQKGRQREYQRLNTKAEVDILVDDRLIQTTTRNISGSGIYINASGKFKTGASVRIVFSVPGQEKPFKLKGTIARVDNEGIAVRFTDITQYFEQILDQVLWHRKASDNSV